MGLRRAVTRGWPVVVDLDYVLPGAPDVVWRLITDWERQSDWMLEASDFRVLTDIREGIGVEAEATIKIGGITTRDRVRVVEWEPGRRLAIEHLGWVKGRGEITLTPDPHGDTTLSWREELHPPAGIAGAAGLSLFRPLMRRVFERDLRVLAALVRAHSSRSSG